LICTIKISPRALENLFRFVKIENYRKKLNPTVSSSASIIYLVLYPLPSVGHFSMRQRYPSSSSHVLLFSRRPSPSWTFVAPGASTPRLGGIAAAGERRRHSIRARVLSCAGEHRRRARGSSTAALGHCTWRARRPRVSAVAAAPGELRRRVRSRAVLETDASSTRRCWEAGGAGGGAELGAEVLEADSAEESFDSPASSDSSSLPLRAGPHCASSPRSPGGIESAPARARARRRRRPGQQSARGGPASSSAGGWPSARGWPAAPRSPPLHPQRARAARWSRGAPARGCRSLAAGSRSWSSRAPASARAGSRGGSGAG